MNLVILWMLLTTPSDRLMCSMWISKPPTQAQLTAAGCVWPENQEQYLVWRAVDVENGSVACERPASELPEITCKLFPLNRYMLQVYWPNWQEWICSVTISHDGKPTPDEIALQCPQAPQRYELRKYSEAAPAQATTAPVCAMPQLQQADLTMPTDALSTGNEYELLDYELRWYYGPGNYNLISWQNQFDRQILDAGRMIRVPPRLLKGMLAQESQFWPLWDQAERDEVGLGQLTDDGADLALRYSPDLYAGYCHAAATPDRCARGYDLLSDGERQMTRDLLRNSLAVHGQAPQAALESNGTIVTWARVLAAYYCAAGETVRPLGLAPSWDYALAAYHSGPECIRTGMICTSGTEYLERVK
jgi:hypothetical protein